MRAATLYTIGYGRWPPERRMRGMIAALQGAKVNTLVDIRHSPCASALDALSNYGPREWHLQIGGGIENAMGGAGIEHRWIVELGNPQKTDPQMAVFRQHLLSGDRRRPAVRGLDLLEALLNEPSRSCCILCACKVWRKCHRAIVAETLQRRRAAGSLQIVHLPVE
jgi:hypothetical protein